MTYLDTLANIDEGWNKLKLTEKHKVALIFGLDKLKNLLEI